MYQGPPTGLSPAPSAQALPECSLASGQQFCLRTQFPNLSGTGLATLEVLMCLLHSHMTLYPHEVKTGHNRAAQ